MLRFAFCLSIVVVSYLALSRGFAHEYAQDAPKLYIEQVTHNPKLKDLPQVFDVEGTATISPQIRGKGNFVVLVFAQSEQGGELQLQMRGEGSSRQPRYEPLIFNNKNTTNWKMRIWLGSKDRAKDNFDPSYTVYAVVVRAFGEADGNRLIGWTHNVFTSFKSVFDVGVLDVLQQRGFQPLVWTDKKGVERYE